MNKQYFNLISGKPKIRRLLTSGLTQLKGNIPFQVSFILRLLSLTSESEQPEATVKEVLNLLENPFMVTFSNMDTQILKEWTKKMFDYSCRVLLNLRLINLKGQPTGLAGIVNHIFYHEPGNLIFVHLLQSGAIHKLCRSCSGEER